MTTAYVMLEWMQIDVCSVSDSRTVKNWLFMVERKTRVMVSVCRKLIPQKQIKGHPVSTNLMTSFLRCLFWSLLYVLYRLSDWLAGGPQRPVNCDHRSNRQPVTLWVSDVVFRLFGIKSKVHFKCHQCLLTIYFYSFLIH